MALKGLGGFQLIVNARDADAVARLRARKHREEKPFAVMCADVGAAASACVHHAAGDAPADRARSADRAARKRHGDGGAAGRPQRGARKPQLGVMLPYTPLHHLLMADVGRPLVCTSGNLSDEPM